MNKNLPRTANWQCFSENGQLAHFYHANGFHLNVYAPLLTQLAQAFSLNALAMRPTWSDVGAPPRQRDWQLYADDLIRAIEQHCHEPVIGIGHSMGATCTALAAHKRPDLFKTLVLIEPAMVSKTVANLVRILPKSLMNRTQPAKGTLRKKDSWSSRADFNAYCRKFSGFKHFSDDAFESMVQHGVFETKDNRFQLSFPKAWEAHNYTQPPDILPILAQLTIPCVAVRGKPSVFFSDHSWKKWQVLCPTTIFKQQLDYGHLLPLEHPSACMALINQGLGELQSG